MALDTQHTIYPCPFSKNYGLPEQQAWLLLKIYFLYRFVSSSLLIMLSYSAFTNDAFDIFNTLLYESISYSYLIFITITATFLFRRMFAYSTQAQITIFSDIVIVTLLMHACGGVTSGLGVLLAFPVAAAGVLIGGRCCLLLASIASFAVFTEQIYVINVFNKSYASLSNAGLLGALFFTIAVLSMLMAQRTEQSENLANQQQQTITRLEELNRYIIQHLQSGVVICDELQNIILSNEASLRFFQVLSSVKTIPEINAQLANDLAEWQTGAGKNESFISLDVGMSVQVQFSTLQLNDENLVHLMIEDMALYNQRLQQNKLASLGRLTASIAHEIRNPLGAISHAGQLLSEEDALSDENKRLTEIIQNHCKRVNHIIEDILRLSRRTPSTKQKVVLETWVPEFVHSFSEEYVLQPQQIKLNVLDQGMTTLFDEGQLRQILANLCSNAIRYGNDESCLIEILNINNRPCVRVIDQGSELDEDVIDHLFEPFFTTSSQGTGLGLYISRELAELNQAKLSYDLTHPKTCFSLSLVDADLGVMNL